MEDEIEEDIMFMSPDFSNPKQELDYISKWDKKLFSYEDFKYSIRRVKVWTAISEHLNEKCEGYQVLCISREPDRKKRKKIERDFAFYTKALFWSDGRRYKCQDISIENKRKKFNASIISYLYQNTEKRNCMVS